MKKLAVVCGLFVLFVAPAFTPLMAQDQQQPSDQNQTPSEETKPAKEKRIYTVSKYELSGGYAFRTYYSPSLATLHMNGWYASFDYNRFTWLGFVGEAVGTGYTQGLLNGQTKIYTFQGGPQVYPFRHHKLTPFGQFLYGIGYYRLSVAPYGGFAANTIDYVVSSWQAGGGLDLALKKENWGVRLVQFDFTSANFYPNTTTYTNRGLLRISAGIVYHFGNR
jgi:hypothetical protein